MLGCWSCTCAGTCFESRVARGSHASWFPFCFVHGNAQAIGAAYARCVLRDAVRRVAILDFDVHHGNGTEAIVRNLVPSVKTHKVSAPFLAAASTLSVPSLRPWLNEDDADNVFFASVHGYEATPGPGGGVFYPGTGKTEAPTVAEDGPAQAQGAENISCDEVGQQPAQTPRQHIYNVGMRKHCRHEWRTRWENDILAPLARFKPDLILISAGFDAHCRDKLNHGFVPKAFDFGERRGTHTTCRLVNLDVRCFQVHWACGG